MPLSPTPPDAHLADGAVTAEPNPLTRLTLPELRRRTSAKWRAYPEDVLPLWVAEMDVPLAAPVAEALRTAVEAGDTGYAMGQPYADALAVFAKERWDWRIDTAHTAIVPDVMLGIVEMLKLITEPGDAVVVNCPVYRPFYQFVGNMGLHVVEAPLGPDLRLDPGALERAFRVHRPRAYLLCNPHNPTGTVHTADELEAVARLAEDHGVRVVADEIHAPLVLPGTGARFVPYLTVPGAGRAFALLSASKAWNLAGAKAALAVAGPGAAAELARMPEEVSHGPSHLGALAHTAALLHGAPWLDALLTGLAANRSLLAGLLAEHLPDVRWRQPEGTFLAWLDCRALGLGDDPAAVLLNRGRVALSHGPDFGTGGAGHARLNLATTPDVLAEGVRRMAAAVTPEAARDR